MKYQNILNISLQQIQIFLKCFEYRNYSRVAEEYNFTPSMISKTIKNLEELLGLQLFVRKFHILEPTPAARELAAGWGNTCGIIMESIYRACDVQEKYQSKVRIGVLETTQFCADYIMVKLEDQSSGNMLDGIEWERKDMHDLPRALEADLVDAIVTWDGEILYCNPKEVGWKRIFSSAAAVFIPRGHELFDKKIESFADFRSSPFITLSPTGYPHYFEYLEKICNKYGFSPILSSICGSTDSARYNLSLGKGIYLAPSLICCDWENEDIRKEELEGEGESDLVIVWKKKNMTHRLEKIIACITH